MAIHDLPQLCHDCSIDVDAEELRLLKLMTRHIIWGKYTAPVKVQQMPSGVYPSDQEKKSLAVATRLPNAESKDFQTYSLIDCTNSYMSSARRR